MKKKTHNISQPKTPSKGFIWALYILVAIYFSVFFLHQANFSGIDLGRHITNGKIFITEHTIVQNNYYSYTEPEYKTINHHWLTGVVFYLIQNTFDFKGLSIFYLALHLAALFLFIKTAAKNCDIRLVALFAVLLCPIMTYRHEIRPEGFSYLFLAFLLFALTKFNNKEWSFNKLLILLLINQLLWVNFHIFFFMQYVIIGAFILYNYLTTKEISTAKKLIVLLFSSIIITLLNPAGISGALVPLTIFDKYGYMVAENMNLFFMIDRFPEMYLHALILIVFIAVVLLIALYKKLALKNIFGILLLIFFSILTLKAVRSLSLLGYISLAFLPAISIQLIPKTLNKLIQFIGYGVVAIIMLGFMSKGYWSPRHYYFGTGLMKGQSKAGDFYVNNNLKGPIFNNYDIGSYLIYYLHGREKVFVDNRPEAYSVPFFDSIYNPAIEKENKWFDLDKKYNFNYIFFYRHDNTTHAQPFLLRRIADTAWIPVFVDDYNIIMAKNNAANKPIIDRFAISKDIFTSVPGN